MNISLIALTALLSGLLAWALYCEWIVPRRRGKTQAVVVLRPQNRQEWGWMTLLVLILLLQQIQDAAEFRVKALLLATLMVSLWFTLGYRKKLWFKSQGFYVGARFIYYRQIEELRLSEDGVLLVKLPQQFLLLPVKDSAGLQVIYRQLLTSPP